MFIETAGFTAVPLLEYEPALNCQVLALELKKNKRKSGTRISFEASTEEYSAAVDLFLDCNKKAKKITDNVFLPGGQVFINGALAAQRNDLLFSYNLTGETAKGAQNRDRTILDEKVLVQSIGKLLSSCKKSRLLEELFRTIKEKANYLEHRTYLAPPASNRRIWKRAIKNIFGPLVCLESDSVSDLEAEGKGYYVLKHYPYSWETCLSEVIGVKHSKDVMYTKRRTQKIPLKYLHYTERDTFLRARKTVRKLFKNAFGIQKLPSIKVVASIRPNGIEKVQGTYSNGTIYLARETLSDFESALRTLIHETMHHVTGAPDCSREFERGWEKLVVRLLKKKKSRKESSKESFRAPKSKKELMCAKN
jgi:hypothetical protein